MLGQDGALRIERGLVQRAARTAASGEVTDAGGDAVAPKPKEKPEFSDALTRRLTAERTLALRATLAAQPRHALTVLVHALVLATFYHDNGSLLGVTVRDECSVHRAGLDADATKAGQALHALERELRAALPAEAEALWTWVVAQDQATQLRYLAYCITPALNTLQDRATSESTTSRRPVAAWREVAALLNLDMADWWQATADTYCNAVSKAKLVEAVKQAKGKDAAAPLEIMKKTGAVTAAAIALEGTRWLPTLLRRG
jgi:ParB family chromosome partitioning protein